MRYDWGEKLAPAEFSREFYDEIDRRFFSDAARYLPPLRRPFDRLIPYDELPRMDVLEIGVGNGSHAQLLAAEAKSYKGIDLTEYATTSTRKRFAALNIAGDIQQMDAEQMTLPANSFDFVWTWGVIHHSANTGQILSEMHRVLRPGGTAKVMVYHRSFLYAIVVTAIIRGVLLGGFLRHSLHQLLQTNTDGAIARFYRGDEWRQLVESRGFVLEDQLIVGQKSEVLPLPRGRLKNFMMNTIPDAATRFITNTCRQGSFLITTLRKP